jgi:isopentenyl-diphosphate delta-isomerase
VNNLERKRGHIEVALEQQSVRSCFDRVRLKHRALPNVSLNAIHLGTDFFGKPAAAPFFVSSMTGGPSESERINRHLAEACNELGIAMGVGSQRISIQEGNVSGLTWSVRNAIGERPLFANFGAVNLPQLDAIQDLGRILDSIEADALILHLNPMQEVFQSSGDTDWRNIIDDIAQVCAWSPVPVVVKEVGFGLDVRSAKALVASGVDVLDVAGMGGTRFADIEIALNPEIHETLSSESVFDGWGYTTIESLNMIKSALPQTTCWASGGIRNGLDVAKSMCLGASAVGVAGKLLRPATESTEAVLATLQQFMSELKISCFGLGVESSKDLNRSHILEITDAD